MFGSDPWRGAAQAHYRDYGKMTYARSVFVVHNIAHQGRGPLAELAPLEVPGAYTHFFRLDDPIGGVHMNVMKAGLMAAHRIVAVSHGCALLSLMQTLAPARGLLSVTRVSSYGSTPLPCAHMCIWQCTQQTCI